MPTPLHRRDSLCATAARSFGFGRYVPENAHKFSGTPMSLGGVRVVKPEIRTRLFALLVVVREGVEESGSALLYDARFPPSPA